QRSRSRIPRSRNAPGICVVEREYVLAAQVVACHPEGSARQVRDSRGGHCEAGVKNKRSDVLYVGQRTDSGTHSRRDSKDGGECVRVPGASIGRVVGACGSDTRTGKRVACKVKLAVAVDAGITVVVFTTAEVGAVDE